MFDKQDMTEEKIITFCPFCQGRDLIKKGQRQKKYETTQVYYCKKCDKKFTPGISKHKTFPLRLILESITLYNRLNTLEETARKITEKYGIPVSSQNISNWLRDFKQYLPFQRMREFIDKKYDKRNFLVECKLFHKQIYDFKYHRAKAELILSEQFKHYKFKPLQDFLEMVVAECCLCFVRQKF